MPISLFGKFKDDGLGSWLVDFPEYLRFTDAMLQALGGPRFHGTRSALHLLVPELPTLDGGVCCGRMLTIFVEYRVHWIGKIN